MDEQKAAILLNKYLKGQCSDDEKALLESWYLLAMDEAADDDLPEPDYGLARQHLQQNLPVHKPRIRKLKTWMKYAAAILLISAAAILFMNRALKQASDIAPGYNQATLTLADGRKISLDSSQSGIIIGDKNIKYNDGNSVLAEKGRSHLASGTYNLERSTYNSLSTPKGGQYQIILNDGTKVWLNAASKLAYPARFSGGRREVELQGEAYFSVNNQATDGRAVNPFVVKTKNQEILVLGTEFNVNTYDQETKTTLASGVVQVATYPVASGNGPQASGIVLKPGEQSILEGNGSLTKTKADIQSTMAWRHGYFSLENKPLEQLMKEVARWYDIDVLYTGKVPDVKFYGDADRNKSLSVVLHLLESAGLTYKLEGRTLSILGNKGEPK